jgi:single-stranded DNA-binding protein
MTILGDNFVSLIGHITNKRFNTYDSGAVLFKCKLAVPTPPDYKRKQYINVGAWGQMAESLGVLSEGTYIKVQGHLEKSSYETTCRYCGGLSNTVWMEVLIDNFTILEK